MVALVNGLPVEVRGSAISKSSDVDIYRVVRIGYPTTVVEFCFFFFFTFDSAHRSSPVFQLSPEPEKNKTNRNDNEERMSLTKKEC